MSVPCDCCVLSRRAFCDGPISHSEKAFLSVTCLSVIQEPHTGGLGPLGLSSHEKKIVIMGYIGLF